MRREPGTDNVGSFDNTGDKYLSLTQQSPQHVVTKPNPQVIPAVEDVNASTPREQARSSPSDGTTGTTYVPPSPEQRPTTPPPFCSRCDELAAENEQVVRRLARSQQRLRDTTEMAQTHGQRLLRAAFQEKVRELTSAHSVKTTEMLNMQKKCFEEELEAMDAESQAALMGLQRELEMERGMRMEAEERYKREREAALEKTTATMVAVQRKMAQLHARVTRLEREKKNLAGTVSEKQVMIEVLASAAAAKDVERKRLEMLAEGRDEERKRKEGMVEGLEKEVVRLRERLAVEQRVNLNLMGRIEELEGKGNGEQDGGEETKEDEKREENNNVKRVARLYCSVIEEFGNAQSDVSTAE